MKAQYGILRFKKYKGPAISPIEAHNERTKEQYASNPDIDMSRSRYNLHLVQPQGKYREEADRMISAAHCRVRKDSVRVVEALVTASPDFFKKKTNREIKAYFEYALEFLKGKQNTQTFISAVVHMDEKTPHLHLCFVPLTADGRLSVKEIIGNRKNLVKWQDEFWQHMVKQYPELERGESASQTGREHIPPRIFKEMTQLTKQKEQLDPEPHHPLYRGDADAEAAALPHRSPVQHPEQDSLRSVCGRQAARPLAQAAEAHPLRHYPS